MESITPSITELIFEWQFSRAFDQNFDDVILAWQIITYSHVDSNSPIDFSFCSFANHFHVRNINKAYKINTMPRRRQEFLAAMRDIAANLLCLQKAGLFYLYLSWSSILFSPISKRYYLAVSSANISREKQVLFILKFYLHIYLHNNIYNFLFTF